MMKTALHRARARLGHFGADNAGTTMVEFAIVLPIFLLLLFGLIEFGRMGFEYVFANKGVQMAARIAVARPPACAGVPAINARGPLAVGAVPPLFGTNCRAGTDVCASPAAVTCAGNATNTTAAEIWGAVDKLMPTGSTIANLRFTYTYTSELGFLGGPYVPMVTVEVQNLNFRFITPLGALAAVAGDPDSDLPGTLPFPDFGTTLPAEDLNLGTAG
jgi:Flp pilus assembly protein TadG